MKKILVPVDFTSVSENAINHAENLARHIEGEIHLLHVVGKKSLLEEAETRMNAYTEMVDKQYDQVKISCSVRQGNIFEDIGEVAVQIDASLIVMGTHGLRGMQFLVGSNALRIVSSSETPIIIVQERGIRAEGYDDIIVPLDLEKETKQKLTIVAKMAKYFNSRVHLISPFEKDEYLKNSLDRNLQYAADMMAQAGIEHTVKVLDKDAGDFDDELISYAVVKEADLITIMNLRESSLAGLLGGGYTQKIITNEAQIPALLINPAQTGHVDIFGM